jgi:DNA-3-methyladenine glycosylase
MPRPPSESWNATPDPAWRSFVEGDPSPLPPAWYARPVEVVARDLLGCVILSEVDGVATSGRILETEAYGGADDPASHAATRRGRTRRNGPMYGPAGTTYLYLIYGIHWCLNAVTGEEGDPQAVLIRSLEPLAGLEAMGGRRGRADELARGPGRLAQALGVDGCLNGHPLQTRPLRILPGAAVRPSAVGVSGRIGIRRARERPHRFYLNGHPGVSSGPHHPGATPAFDGASAVAPRRGAPSSIRK